MSAPATKPLDDDARYVMVRVDAIDASDRMREVRNDKAEELSESIAVNGLIHAITVRETPEADVPFALIQGGHRLRAHQILGVEYIKAEVTVLPAAEAMSIERDENFFREGLTKVEEAIAAGSFLREWEALNGPVARGGDRTGTSDGAKGQTLPFADFRHEIGEKSGKSDRSIKDLLSVYRHLGEEVLKELSDSPIADNMVQLKALAKLDMGQRGDAVREISEGRAASVKDWQVAAGHVPEKPKKSEKEEWMASATKLWAEGKKAWQDQFLKQVGATR